MTRPAPTISSRLTRAGRPRRRTAGALLAVAAALGACGRDDTRTGPGEPSLAGQYYGVESYGPATCAPTMPPPERGFNPAAVSLQRLLTITHAGSLVSGAGFGGAATMGFSGAVAADGTAALDGVGGFEVPREPALRVAVRVRLELRRDAKADRLGGAASVVTEERDAITNALVRTCTRTGSVDLARHAAAVPELPARDCAAEAELRSQTDAASALLVVRNHTGRSVNVYWRNYQGQRVQVARLAPDYTVGLSAWVTHPFVVTDDAGRCLAAFVVTAGGPAAAVLR